MEDLDCEASSTCARFGSTYIKASSTKRHNYIGGESKVLPQWSIQSFPIHSEKVLRWSSSSITKNPAWTWPKQKGNFWQCCRAASCPVWTSSQGHTVERQVKRPCSGQADADIPFTSLGKSRTLCNPKKWLLPLHLFLTSISISETQHISEQKQLKKKGERKKRWGKVMVSVFLLQSCVFLVVTMVLIYVLSPWLTMWQESQV